MTIVDRMQTFSGLAPKMVDMPLQKKIRIALIL